MNPLEQLVRDLDEASCWECEDEVEKVARAFIEKYEAVEVDAHGDYFNRILYPPWGSRMTILVPRKQGPTLLEAAEAASEHWEAEGVVFSCPEGRKFCTRMDALRTAIAKEER